MVNAYFLGAGASVGAGYPVTGRLLDAALARLSPKEPHVDATSREQLLLVLHEFFGISETDVAAAAQRAKKRSPAPPGWPQITDVLSMLDAILAQGVTLGNGTEVFDARYLDGCRQTLVACVILALRGIREREKRYADLQSLVTRAVAESAAILTTNWDSLLDRTTPTGSYDAGTDAKFTASDGPPFPPGGSPPTGKILLKLHGAVNWSECPRCERLYVNPHVDYAWKIHSPLKRGGPAVTCDCELPALRPVLVAQSFVREYRDRHLRNVWSAARQRLADAERWVLWGYGFPPEDIAVKVLFLTALSMRRSASRSGGKLEVDIVNPDAAAVAARLRAIRLPKAPTCFANFKEWAEKHTES